jgi:hypothetical protein
MTKLHLEVSLEPIPLPPARVALGNSPDIEGDAATIELMRLAGK